ncbi:hypothetical protein [Massilia antarctica]|uniref:hypothetical protein n=1 Tax=Massilia antarctica TaxID=2765360 RepID=UPI0006BB71A1|nr:hypothetical protein [Massilia sp. H27-R4]MCY0912836.1 hypothetical protein [Massilia sp. H27-R4]CUI07408.1 hypothetical protein BN2497_9593 [Janthinobacterium sp. CG23_2]CUU31194.1 hypothetical protein BN3177_9593 [Janthinobacterium sp. CG23_2]
MSFLRAVGLLLALAVMVGFGACGVLGLILGAHAASTTGFNEVIVYGCIGLGIAAMIAWGIYRRVRTGGLRRASTPPGP